MKAYGFSIKNTSEADCVANLMEMYQELSTKRKINLLHILCKFIKMSAVYFR